MAYLDNTGLAYFWGKITAVFAKKADVDAALGDINDALEEILGE